MLFATSLICASLFTSAWAFSIVAPGRVSAGRSSSVSWTRHSGDPENFILAVWLLSGPRPSSGTQISSGGRDTGSASLSFPNAGEYIIEVYRNQPFNSPLTGSSRIVAIREESVANPPVTPPNTTTKSTPAPTTTSRRATEATRDPQPTQGGNGNNSDNENGDDGVPGTSLSSQRPTDEPVEKEAPSSLIISSTETSAVASFAPAATSSRSGNRFVNDQGSVSQQPTGAATGVDSTTLPEPTATLEVPSGATRKTSPGAIAGIIIAIIAILAILAALFIHIRRRRRRRATAFYGEKMFRAPPAMAEAGYADQPTERQRKWTSIVSGYDDLFFNPRSAANSTPSDATVPEGASVHLMGQNGSVRASTISSILTSDSESTVHARVYSMARTDRQMLLHEKITSLQLEMMRCESVQVTNGMTGSADPQIRTFQERISALNNLMQSPWALNRSDERPPALSA